MVPSRGPSKPLNFDLKAAAVGRAELRVLAFRTGEPLGGITLETVVEVPTERPTRSITPPTRRRRGLARPSPQLPDLTLFVEEWEGGGQHQYRMLVSSPDPELELNLLTFGPFELELDPAAFFEEFFEEIDRLPRKTKAERDVADRRVAAKGAYLSEQLMPDELRETLWEVRDRISSIIVQSEEPWIPWELCRLVGREGGQVVEGPFLCEAYTITRWLPGVGFKRPLSLRKIAVVVPDDSAATRHAGARLRPVAGREGPQGHRVTRDIRRGAGRVRRTGRSTAGTSPATGQRATRTRTSPRWSSSAASRYAGDGERERHERRGLAPGGLHQCLPGGPIRDGAHRHRRLGEPIRRMRRRRLHRRLLVGLRRAGVPLRARGVHAPPRRQAHRPGRPRCPPRDPGARRPDLARVPSSRIRWRRSAPESRMDRPEQPTGDVA